ncbi:MAG: pyridoxamine 5'-phosphate oxidase family protein [Nitrososphaerota archaeon]|nr:pyridoxamine 5'-phosphate oxidase family protein [Nitrososphaerota archaeon]
MEVQKVLDEGCYLYLAAVKPTNKPDVTMVAYVLGGKMMTMISRANSIKVRNLRKNPTSLV